MFFAGLGNGLGAGITIGEPQTIWRLTLAGLAFVPAMAAIAGVAALAVALRQPVDRLAGSHIRHHLAVPRRAAAAAAVAARRCRRSARPRRRSEYSAVALAVMVVAAAALTLVAGAIYRRRDAI